jgi:hypothetical protein
MIYYKISSDSKENDIVCQSAESTENDGQDLGLSVAYYTNFIDKYMRYVKVPFEFCTSEL